MNSKVDIIKNPDLGRYLQSLDSVRFLESNDTACQAQAKLEVFTSLMLGRTIPVGEHQFIDSYGLLSNAYDLIEALENMPRSDRVQIERFFPFQLFYRREYKTIDGLIATKLGDPKYKLSLWSKLSESDNKEMVHVREEIKKKIEDGTFRYEDDDLVPSGDYEAAKMLHKVRNHFLRGERKQIITLYGADTTGFAPYIGLLEKGIEKICSWTERDLDVQIAYQAKLVENGLASSAILESSMKKPAIALISMLNTLREKGLIISNRSHIRIGNLKVSIRGKEKEKKFRDFVNPTLYDGMLEIFDTLYNSSIAKSCSSHSESVSSARNIVKSSHVRAAMALSTMVKNEITDQSELLGNHFNPPWMQSFMFNLGETSYAKKMLQSMPWSHVWEAFADRKWRKTVSNLNHVLLKWDALIKNPTSSEQEYMDITYELDYAYNAHIENIARILEPSGWAFVKEQESTKIQFLPLVAGALGAGATSLIIGQTTLDPFWEETFLELSAGGASGFVAQRLVEPAGRWLTKGYIRKTFARLI